MALNREIIAFRARFPSFVAAKDADIAAAINTAGAMVKDDGTYTDSDYPLALDYYAAWLLALMSNQSASVNIGGSGMSDVFVNQIHFGERTTVFQQRQPGQRAQTTATEALMLTNSWGILFLQIRDRNVPPIMVI